MKLPKKRSEITQRHFLFGDFDGDGVRNIDDPRPFKKSTRRIKRNPSHYHKARYSGGEIKLSGAIRKVQKTNNKTSPFLKKFLKTHKGSYGRIKTVPSTINKLNKRYSKKLSDVGGVTIIKKTRKEVYAKARQIKKKYKHKKKDIDNYYRKPKGGVYYAYHINIENKKKRKLEVQIKTKKMEKLQKKMHRAYKTDKSMKPFKKKAKKLYKQGY